MVILVSEVCPDGLKAAMKHNHVSKITPVTRHQHTLFVLVLSVSKLMLFKLILQQTPALILLLTLLLSLTVVKVTNVFMETVFLSWNQSALDVTLIMTVYRLIDSNVTRKLWNVKLITAQLEMEDVLKMNSAQLVYNVKNLENQEKNALLKNNAEIF